MAIGVDSDQYKTADPTVQDVIMTSMLKKVDVAVFDFIKPASTTATSRPAPTTYDLKDGGRLRHQRWPGRRHQDQARGLKAKIISGEITVPTEVARHLSRTASPALGLRPGPRGR